MAIDEDEEFKLAEQLAESFSLTHDSADLDRKELSVALQRSYQQLMAEEKQKIDNLSTVRKNSGADSLTYSITASSRPMTNTNFDTTTRTDDQLVDSVSRSQMPSFTGQNRDFDDDEGEALG